MIPCPIKLKPSQRTVVTVEGPSGPSAETTKQTNTCNGLVKFHNTKFYGRWNVKAGTTAVKCKAVFTVYNNGKVVGTGTLHVTVT